MQKNIYGKRSEIVAANYLKKKKYKILEMNYKNNIGEIDIIAKDKNYIVFCKNIGQIKKFFESPYEDIMDYCDTIINEIGSVPSGNVLNITNKLSLKEDDNKWDLNLFFNILEWKKLT